MNSSYKLSFTFVKSSMSSITVILSTCYFSRNISFIYWSRERRSLQLTLAYFFTVVKSIFNLLKKKVGLSKIRMTIFTPWYQVTLQTENPISVSFVSDCKYHFSSFLSPNLLLMVKARGSDQLWGSAETTYIPESRWHAMVSRKTSIFLFYCNLFFSSP